MKVFSCCFFAVLWLCPSVVMAQNCGLAGQSAPCTGVRPQGTQVQPRPAGQDTSGPGRVAPPLGPPPINRDDLRGKTPTGTIAAPSGATR
jgi:hypothetical protein